MADLVTIMQTMRRNPGYIPDWAWFRDGEESAVIGGEIMGSIEISDYNEQVSKIPEEMRKIKGGLRHLRRMVARQAAIEWLPKYR